jgi:hypothetical protein
MDRDTYWVGGCAEEKNLLLLPGTEPWFFGHPAKSFPRRELLISLLTWSKRCKVSSDSFIFVCASGFPLCNKQTKRSTNPNCFW